MYEFFCMTRVASLVILLFFCLFTSSVAGCGKGKTKVPHPYLSEDTVNRLSNIRQQNMNWIPMKDGVFIFDHNKDNGNSSLFMGLLCWSGESWACIHPRLQETSGEIHRAPWRTDHSTSRDEFIGFMYYVWKTKDYERGNLLLNFIRSNNDMLCPDETKCKMTGQTWFLANTVGLSCGHITEEVDAHTLLVEAGVNQLGFRTHLVALHLLARKFQGLRNPVYDKAAETLYKRMPQNIFYEYIYKGNSEELAKKFIEFAPKEIPTRQSEWVWESPVEHYRSDITHSASIVFMTNVLLEH